MKTDKAPEKMEFIEYDSRRIAALANAIELTIREQVAAAGYKGAEILFALRMTWAVGGRAMGVDAASLAVLEEQFDRFVLSENSPFFIKFGSEALDVKPEGEVQ